MKEIIKDMLWYIRAFLCQPTVPTVSIQYIIDNNCSYTANDFMIDKYVYYWKGDYKTGKAVKVRSLDMARYEYTKLKEKLNKYENEI